MTEEIRQAWARYQQADIDNDQAEWDHLTEACAEAGMYVSEAADELCTKGVSTSGQAIKTPLAGSQERESSFSRGNCE